MSVVHAQWLAGAWDIHVHAEPSLFPRRGDGLELADAAAEAAMAGLVLKAHHGSTVESARLVARARPGIACLGGLVLNHFVGGLNPTAVEASVRLGGRIVWLPTIHAAHHIDRFGPGGFPFQQTGLRPPPPGIRIVDAAGRVVDAVRDILALLDGRGTVLATGYISADEIVALERQIDTDGRRIRLLINHVLFTTPRLRTEQLRELVGPNVWLETCYFTVSHLARVATFRELAAAVGALPGAQWVLASDCGQPDNPMPPDALAAACQGLADAGADPDLVSRMVRDHPRKLLAA